MNNFLSAALAIIGISIYIMGTVFIVVRCKYDGIPDS